MIPIFFGHVPGILILNADLTIGENLAWMSKEAPRHKFSKKLTTFWRGMNFDQQKKSTEGSPHKIQNLCYHYL